MPPDPNTEVWGQPNNLQKYHGQDLVTIPNDELEEDESASIIKVNDVNQDNDAKIAIYAENSSTNVAARALVVSGQSEMGVTGEEGVALELFGSQNVGEGIALRVNGSIVGGLIEQIVKFGDPIVVGERVNIRAEPEGQSAAIDGTNSPLWLGTAAQTIAVSIGNTDKNLSLLGDSVYVHGATRVDGAIKVGVDGIAGSVDANGGQILKLGSTSGATTNVELSRANQSTTVKGTLAVDQAATVTGALTATGNITAGPSNNVGKVDANNNHDLKLGTENATADVYLCHNGKMTYVDGGISVASNGNVGGTFQAGGNAALLGTLAVGPLAGAGSIDAGGSPNAQNLAIGAGNATADVRLGRAGQTIDMFCNERLNSHEVILNGVANLANAASAGLVYNAAGHGPNGKSIDFYIDGAVRAYIDVLGIH